MLVKTQTTKFAAAMLVCFVFGAPMTLLAAETPSLPPSAKTEIVYERDIRPILARNCRTCHGPDEQQSNFRVDVRAALLNGGDYGEPGVLPGKSEKSHLIRVVAGVDEDLVMPPEGEGKRLTPEQIGLLRAWVDQGLKMPDVGGESITTDHWSFQPIVRPEPPALDDAWIANPIDAFILQRLRRRETRPVAAGGQSRFDSPGLSRHARTASHAPRGRKLRRRRFASGLQQARRPRAHQRALRRAVGEALARRGAICRIERLRD